MTYILDVKKTNLFWTVSVYIVSLASQISQGDLLPIHFLFLLDRSQKWAELQYTSWWDGSGMKFEMGGMDPTWKKTIIFKQDVISEIFLVFLKTYFGHQKKSRIWPKNSEDVWEFFPSQYHYYCIPCPGSISSKTFVCYRCSWQDGWGWGWRRYFFI